MTTLDIHNKTASEAQILVKGFIRERFELRDYNILIIHGFGQSIMRGVVWSECEKNKLVDKYELAPPRLGGGGVTYIELKKKTWRTK
ncbi:Smr/MutS family protein [Mollicutes bacterium LVI A0039]|nr:Smr/MutS family protein [Mollicutes bacterium LVI A0039]